MYDYDTTFGSSANMGGLYIGFISVSAIWQIFCLDENPKSWATVPLLVWNDKSIIFWVSAKLVTVLFIRYAAFRGGAFTSPNAYLGQEL